MSQKTTSDGKPAPIYKKVWFWVLIVLSILLIIGSVFFITREKPGVTKANYDKIVLADDNFGKNGTTIEKATKLLGNPDSKSNPDKFDAQYSKENNEPYEFRLVWSDGSDEKDEFGQKTGVVSITFASKTNDASKAGAVDKTESLKKESEVKSNNKEESQSSSENNEKKQDSKYEKIYNEYSEKMQNETTKLISEMDSEVNTDASSIEDVESIAEDKDIELSNINEDASNEMSDYMFDKEQDESQGYSKWSEKMNKLYIKESKKISDHAIKLENNFE